MKIAIAITFIGSTPFRKDIDENELGLAVRALYSYFVGNDLPFDKFLKAIRPTFYDLDLSLAINSIMIHSGKGVLLLVDEILKSGGKSRDQRFNTRNVYYQIKMILKSSET